MGSHKEAASCVHNCRHRQETVKGLCSVMSLRVECSGMEWGGRAEGHSERKQKLTGPSGSTKGLGSLSALQVPAGTRSPAARRRGGGNG